MNPINITKQMARDGYGWQDIQRRLKMDTSRRDKCVWEIIKKTEFEKSDWATSLRAGGVK